MVTVVTREANGIPLTHEQVDDNFTGLANAINNLGDDVLAPAIAAKDAAVVAASAAQTSALNSANSADAASISRGNAATSAESANSSASAAALSAAASAASVNALALADGSSKVGLTPVSPGVTGSKTTTIEKYVQTAVTVNIFSFFTNAQISDVLSKNFSVYVGDDVYRAVNSLPLGSTLIVPDGGYKMDGRDISIGNTSVCYIQGVGFPEFRWSSLPVGVDAITLVGAGYQRQGLQNLNLNLNFTGRNGITILSGDHPYLRTVKVSSPLLDGIAVICNNYNWAENIIWESVLVESAGRHTVYFETSGPNGAFINESTFTQIEGRGVARKVSGGCFMYFKCAGTVNSKMSQLRFLSCNADADRAGSIANGFDIGPNPVVLSFTSGGSNLYEGFDFVGGSWENISGPPDYRSAGLVVLEQGAIATGCNFSLGVEAGWSGGSIKGSFRGETMKRQNGIWRTQYPNSWTQQSAVASSTFNMLVGLPSVPQISGTRTYQASAYELSIFVTGYAGTDQTAYKQDIYIRCYVQGVDQYYTFLPPATVQQIGSPMFTLNSAVVINSSGGTTLNSTTPPSAVRVSITTTALFATGGRDTKIQGLLCYKGASHEEFQG